MIEETLLKSNYLGKDGFIWWLGQVAPAKEWDTEAKTSLNYEKNPKAWPYRCKVRIIGYHTFNKNELKDPQLPWAHIMLSPTDGNGQAGLGKTHKLVGGETVFGFFLDGDDAQQPVVMGVLHRNSNVKSFEIDDEIAFKPFSGAKYGRVKQGPTKASSTKTTQNPVGTASTENIIGGQMQSPIGVGISSTTPATDKLNICDKALQKALATAKKVEVIGENGCDNNMIGKITRAIQDFIAVVNGLQGYLDTYIDPVLNVFVDITNEIKRTARTIVGTIKFLINNMRNVISKLVGCIFSKFIGLVVQIPEQPKFGEAAKNILNVIFCIFEKIIDRLLPFIENLLQGLVGRALNAPLCAIEEVTATILNKLLDIIDELLAPVFSGIDWLVGGLSQVSSILSTATSIATEIFNLIGCDNLKCKTPSKWALDFGPSQADADNWNRVVGKMNVIRGFNDGLDSAVNKLSIFGGGGSPIFRDCANIVNNPSSQDDLVNTGNRAPTCVPPKVEIFGDGIGASAIAVIGDNGSVLSIEVLTEGFGYSRPPSVNIIDKSNFGSGARAEAVTTGGKVTQIYITSPGSGYCKTDLEVLYRQPYYIVTANKYSFYEGESVTFTILTENVTDGTELRYYLSGDINNNDIEDEFEGTVIIFNNTAEVSIEVKQDNESEILEEIIFNLEDAEESLVARATVLVSDQISPVLPPGQEVIIPKGLSTLFGPIPGIGSNNTGIVTSFVVVNPGLGYSSTDTAFVGDCTASLIVSPDGSVVGINSLVCPTEFTNFPNYGIDSNTGEGATIYPVIKFTPKVNVVPQISINDKGVIKIVDCV